GPAANAKADPMANVMSIEKRNTILRHLVEGNSIRSTCRLMGSQIHTVLRQLEWAGKHCEALLAERLQGVHCRHLEVDEIWTWCARKQANLTIEERALRHDIGDLYLFTAQDQDSRLIVHHFSASAVPTTRAGSWCNLQIT